MGLTHFPIVLNRATTGHKLQGKSVDKLVIAQWTKTRNWGYVVVSRVKTLSGLYLLEPVPKDFDFSPPAACLQLMQRLRNTVLILP